MNGWIDKRERLPEKEDGDAQGCVLVWHENNGHMIMHYSLVKGLFVTHWQRLPGRPYAKDEQQGAAARDDAVHYG